jgi:hypothetical protein
MRSTGKCRAKKTVAAGYQGLLSPKFCRSGTMADGTHGAIVGMDKPTGAFYRYTSQEEGAG